MIYLTDKEKKLLSIILETEIIENKGRIDEHYLDMKDRDVSYLIQALSDRNVMLEKIIQKLKEKKD